MDDADWSTLPIITWPDHAPPWPIPLPAARADSTSEGPASIAGGLLQVARWHAGLSQAEAAVRANTSQQTWQRYETGRTQPTLPTLQRLLAACGMDLDAALVPLADFDDPAIQKLLDRPPLERLPLPHREAVAAALPAFTTYGIDAVLADKAAARLYGAPVKVWECVFWVDGDCVRHDELEAMLTAAGGCEFWRFARTNENGETDEADDEADIKSFGRHWSWVAGAEVHFRAVADFAGVRRRAHQLEVDGVSVPVLSPSDVVRPWHVRDRDRLLLARAVLQSQRRVTQVLT
jgi:transcriptional regulator with XRE-family HTH domain